MTDRRPLFGTARPGDHDLKPLVERLPSASATVRGSLPISQAAPAPRLLFGAQPAAAATPGLAAPTAASDPAQVEREIAQIRAEAERSSKAMAAEVEAIRGRYAAALTALDRAVTQAATPPIDDLVELAMVIAGEIVGRELTTDRAQIAAALDEALAMAGDDVQGAVVRVNSDDLAYVHAHHAERFAGVELVADPKLAAGGCVVETARAVVDASIESRMAAVRRAVAAVLAGGESS